MPRGFSRSEIMSGPEMRVNRNSNSGSIPHEVSSDELLRINETTFAHLVEAFKVFENDYAIVGHGGEELVSIFGQPRPGQGKEEHKYTVTTVPGDMNEEEFKRTIRRKKVVVIDMCMDARGAVNTYAALAAEAKQQYGPNVVILLLSHGGGIVQVDEIPQLNQATNQQELVVVDRMKASQTIYRYLAKYEKQIVKIYVGGHDCRCGACALYNGGVGVPEKLGVEKGAPVEFFEMQRLVGDSAKKTILEPLRDKVELFIACFLGDAKDSVLIERDTQRKLK